MPVCSCSSHPSPWRSWACGNSFDHHLDLGGAPDSGPNTSDDKLTSTLVASAMAGARLHL